MVEEVEAEEDFVKAEAEEGLAAIRQQRSSFSHMEPQANNKV